MAAPVTSCALAVSSPLRAWSLRPSQPAIFARRAQTGQRVYAHAHHYLNLNLELAQWAYMKRWDTMCQPLSCTQCGRKQRSHQVHSADSLSNHSLCVFRRLSASAVVTDFHACRSSCLLSEARWRRCFHVLLVSLPAITHTNTRPNHNKANNNSAWVNRQA